MAFGKKLPQAKLREVVVLLGVLADLAHGSKLNLRQFKLPALAAATQLESIFHHAVETGDAIGGRGIGHNHVGAADGESVWNDLPDIVRGGGEVGAPLQLKFGKIRWHAAVAVLKSEFQAAIAGKDLRGLENRRFSRTKASKIHKLEHLTYRVLCFNLSIRLSNDYTHNCFFWARVTS